MLITSGVLVLCLTVVVGAHDGPVLKLMNILWGTNSGATGSDGIKRESLSCAFLNKEFCITDRPLKNLKMSEICSNEPIQEVAVPDGITEANKHYYSFKDGSKNKYEIHQSLIFFKLVEIDQNRQEPFLLSHTEFLAKVNRRTVQKQVTVEDDARFPVPISKVAVEELLNIDLKFIPLKHHMVSQTNNNQLAKYYKAKACDDIPHYDGRDQFCFELIDFPLSLLGSVIKGALVHPQTNELCGIFADWAVTTKPGSTKFSWSVNIAIIRVTLLTSFIDKFDNFVSGNDNEQEVTGYIGRPTKTILDHLYLFLGA